MRIACRRQLSFVILTLLLVLVLAEVLVRVGATRDDYGNLSFAGRPLCPRRFGWEHQLRAVQRWKANELSAYIEPSATLGWTIRANATFDGYRSNALGIRSSVPTSPLPPAERTRIVVVGGSFTHGDEVPNDATWSHALEQRLRQAGREVELLNLGVPAYGIDQALLRYLDLGARLRPAVVILGVMELQQYRNQNINRPLVLFHLHHLAAIGVPFTKPRFVLRGEGLDLVPNPVQRLEQMAPFLRGFSSSSHVRYERFHSTAAPSWCQRSRLCGLLGSLGEAAADREFPRNQVYYRDDPMEEAGVLATLIVRRFVHQVRRSGAAPLVVCLPNAVEQIQGQEPQQLFDLMRKEGLPVVTAVEALRGVARLAGVDALFLPRRHYTARANEAVADALLPVVSGMLSTSR